MNIPNTQALSDKLTHFNVEQWIVKKNKRKEKTLHSKQYITSFLSHDKLFTKKIRRCKFID